MVSQGSQFLTASENKSNNGSLGALSVQHLKRIVIDASHIDQKKRGIMDMKDTMLPLAKWLSRKEFKDRYAAERNPIELLFF